MNKTIKIGILGIGTVGGGVVRVLQQNAELIRRRLGVSIEIRRIVRRDVEREVPEGVDWRLLTSDVSTVLRDPEIDIVVEVMGGYEPARKYLLEAMEEGKQVVTANKALLAVHGEELFRAADRKGVDLFFEGSVGGGIPIIQILKESLAANRIESLYGIINGTSNYILTQMSEKNREFGDVLREAQMLGYAEADPTLDVEGVDAAHKLAVLISLAYGTPVDVKEIFTEGISGVSSLDIGFAGELGYRIKLLAIAKKGDETLEARVHPTLVPARHPIARVEGVFNAIYVLGDSVGPCLFHGRGAGELPTASAVVADIIAAARNRLSRAAGRVPSAGYQSEARTPMRILRIEEITSHYYFRFMALDRPGVLSRISGILGEHNISLASVIQKERKEGENVPLVMMTHEARERDVRQALVEIDGLPIVSEKTAVLRVEEER